MNVKIFYEDKVGITSITMIKNNEKEATDVFNTYYRGYKLLKVVRQK